MAGELAARVSGTMRGCFTLVGKARRQRAAEMIDRALGIIAVITALVAGRQNVQRVMHIVVPLRPVIALEPPRLVAVVFEYEMNHTIRDASPHRFGELRQNV